MSKVKKIIGNSAFVLLARGFETVSGIVVLAMLARYLGVSVFGEYSFIMAVVWISQPVVSMGLPRVLAMEVSRDTTKAERYIGMGVTWNIIVFVALAPVLWLLSIVFDVDPVYFLAGLFITVFMSLMQAIGAVFIAYERMSYETYTSLVSMCALVLLIAGAMYLDLGLLNVLGATAAAYLCGFVAAALLNHQVAGFIPRPNADFKGLRHLLSESHSLAVFQVLMQVFLYTGVFFLKGISGNIDVALFQASLRVFTRFMIIPLSVMVALLPVFSRLAASEDMKDELVHTAKTSYKLLLIAGMLITINAFALARVVIPFIFGEAFVNSIVGFKILLLGTTFFFLESFFVMLFIACRRLRSLVKIQLLGLLACALLNFILVPGYGHIGSAWALVLSSCITSFGGYYLFRDILQKDSLKAMGSIFASGFGIIAAVNWVSSINIFIPLIAGTASFVSAIFILKLASWDELQPVLRVIRHRPIKSEVQG